MSARRMLPDIDLISMVWLHEVFMILPVSILSYNIGSPYLVHSEHIPPGLIFLFMVNWRCEIFAKFQWLDKFHHYNTRRVSRYQRVIRIRKSKKDRQNNVICGRKAFEVMTSTWRLGTSENTTVKLVTAPFPPFYFCILSSTLRD
jgi:hypothetical protein